MSFEFFQRRDILQHRLFLLKEKLVIFILKVLFWRCPRNCTVRTDPPERCLQVGWTVVGVVGVTGGQGNLCSSATGSVGRVARRSKGRAGDFSAGGAEDVNADLVRVVGADPDAGLGVRHRADDGAEEEAHGRSLA